MINFFVISVHVYKYLIDGWDHTMYPRPRFASEYGFQSLPSYKTLSTAMDVYSIDFLNHRQHHLGGYEEMKLLMSKHINLGEMNGVNGLKKFIFYSQVCMKFF